MLRDILIRQGGQQQTTVIRTRSSSSTSSPKAARRSTGRRRRRRRRSCGGAAGASRASSRASDRKHVLTTGSPPPPPVEGPPKFACRSARGPMSRFIRIDIAEGGRNVGRSLSRPFVSKYLGTLSHAQRCRRCTVLIKRLKLLEEDVALKVFYRQLVQIAFAIEIERCRGCTGKLRVIASRTRRSSSGSSRTASHGPSAGMRVRRSPRGHRQSSLF